MHPRTAHPLAPFQRELQNLAEFPRRPQDSHDVGGLTCRPKRLGHFTIHEARETLSHILELMHPGLQPIYGRVGDHVLGYTDSEASTVIFYIL